MFCPDDTLTRGQMAKFLMIALYGDNFSYNPTPYFTDVPPSHLLFKYIQRLRQDNIHDRLRDRYLLSR